MSKEREEPKISLSLDDDEIAQRGNGKNSPPVKANPNSSGGGGTALFLLAVLVIGLGGACYYLYQQLTMAQAQLLSSQDRLEALEQRLSAADDSLEENSVTTQVKLKELDSEIRKLWDNVWKKQKAELAEHDTELEKYGKRLSSLESKASSNDKQLSAALQQFKKDSESRESMSSKLDRVIAQAEVNRKTLLDVNKELTAGGSLDARVKELETRMAQSEEWLDSVNAFRRQVNRGLEALRQTVTQYHRASPAP